MRPFLTISLLILSLSLLPQQAFSKAFYYKVDIENLRFQGRAEEGLIAVFYAVGNSNKRAFEISREHLGRLKSETDHQLHGQSSFYISEDEIDRIAQRYTAYSVDPSGYQLRVKLLKYRTFVDQHLFSVQIPLPRAAGQKYFNFLAPDDAHQITLGVIARAD